MTEKRDLSETRTCGNERPVLPARQLFGNTKEIAIDYHGTVYRLRITRNDKLILTK